MKLWLGPEIIFLLFTDVIPHLIYTHLHSQDLGGWQENLGWNPCHSNSFLSNTASPSSSTLALSGWDSVRLRRAGLFHLVAPHAQHRGGVKGAGWPEGLFPEGSWLILHLCVLKKEAVANSVLHIPLLLFIKTQEQLGKGDEGLYI